MEVKTCTSRNGCGKTKLVTEFVKDGKSPGGYRSICVACNRVFFQDRADARKWRMLTGEEEARLDVAVGAVEHAIAVAAHLMTPERYELFRVHLNGRIEDARRSRANDVE